MRWGFKYGQFLITENEGKKILYLLDIEAYTKTK